MKRMVINIIEVLLLLAAIVFSLNYLLDRTGITITVGKKQEAEIYIYPQGSHQQRL